LHSKRSSAALAAVFAALAAGIPECATAATAPDEIQVYTDELTKRGEHGVELHVNTTPRGRNVPDYPRAALTQHGLRMTPEISFGLTEDTDWAVYVPTVRDAAGNWYLPGIKLRAKWLPVRGDEKTGGPYLGVNGEISNVSYRFSQSRVSSELRFIAGYRSEDWLFGVNPIFSWGLSPGQRESNPEFETAWKAARRVLPGISLGMEYYAGTGKFRDALPASEQERALYLTLDVERAPWVFNVGIGKGLTDATDRWTLKAIFELPF